MARAFAPFAIMPPMSALAMLPPPTKASVTRPT
jgi:hypothetical protein